MCGGMETTTVRRGDNASGGVAISFRLILMVFGTSDVDFSLILGLDWVGSNGVLIGASGDRFLI